MRADRVGLFTALGCYGLWGVLPILFQAVERAGAGPFETVAWRTIWALPFAAALVAVSGQIGWLRRIDRRTMAALTLSAALIAVNWSTYVWAVDRGRTLEGSLGYYINPLVSIAAGRLVFGEPISRTGWIAIGLAAAGVALQAAALGALPWASVLIALSFSGYSVVRKRTRCPAQGGLLVECAILAPIAAVYLAWLTLHGAGVFGRSAPASLLLVACGPMTAIPLAMFVFAAGRLPLTLIGLLQFLTPTLQFLVGVEDGERLTPLRLASFALIWVGVAVFAYGAWRAGRAPA